MKDKRKPATRFYAISMGEGMFIRQFEIKKWRGKTTRNMRFCEDRGDAILFDHQTGSAWREALNAFGDCQLVEVER